MRNVLSWPSGRALAAAGIVAVGCMWSSLSRAQQPGEVSPTAMPLAAPQPNAPRNSTEADLQNSEKEDTGLGLEWVYLNAEVGTSYIDMKSFSESQLALTDTNKVGAMFGVGAGVRLLFLSLGLRAREHTAFNLWQINAEVAFHTRVWRIDPYLLFRGGYDTVGNLSQAVDNVQNTSVDVHGWNAGAALGLDFYFTSLLSLGGELSGDVLFLKRAPAAIPAGIPPAQQAAIQQQPLYQNSGSSVGFGGGLSAHLGLHF